MVFDTRPDAAADGEWNSHIERNILKRPLWQEAFESLETKAIDVVLPDGSKRKISSDTDAWEEEYVAIFGEVLKGVLVKAREEGILKLLPKAKRCHWVWKSTMGAMRGPISKIGAKRTWHRKPPNQAQQTCLVELARWLVEQQRASWISRIAWE